MKHWTQARWASTTTSLHKCMPTPSNSGQGVGLSRRAWTRLNRLRTGVGRFGANMLRWGPSTSDCCDCGAEKTADHITSGLCPIHRPPEGSTDLSSWTSRRGHGSRNVPWTCDGTRDKKRTNNHVTYYVITQVGVYAAQQWYVITSDVTCDSRTESARHR